jgi:hypothetical protein
MGSMQSSILRYLDNWKLIGEEIILDESDFLTTLLYIIHADCQTTTAKILAAKLADFD